MSDQEACAPSLQFQQAHNLLGHPLVRDGLHCRIPDVRMCQKMTNLRLNKQNALE